MIKIKYKDPELMNNRARASISVYLMDHFTESKRIEFLENLYGGKAVAHRSAKIIQRYFRNYKTGKLIKPAKLHLPTLSPILSIESSITSDSLSEISLDSVDMVNTDLDDPFDILNNPERRRLLTLGKNIFNRNCNKGINFLIKHNIIAEDPESILRLLKSEGISLYVKGEYLSQEKNSLSLETRNEYLRRMSFHDCSIEKGIRRLFSQVRIPGESQNLVTILEGFSNEYLFQNPHMRSKIKNENTILILAYGILMLHTGIHNKRAAKKDRLTKKEFLHLFKCIYEEEFITNDYLGEIYENVKRKKMTTISDLTDHVRNIFISLTGRFPKDLIQNYRKFVCVYSCNEISDINRKPDSNTHSRVLYLFNDLLLVTKEKSKGIYRVKRVIKISGLLVELFTAEYYGHGLRLTQTLDLIPNNVIHFNFKDEWVKVKLQSDLSIYIDEICQLEEYFAQENALI